MAEVGVTMQDAAENMLAFTNGSDVLNSPLKKSSFQPHTK